jgi:hypothetical protein
LPLLPLPDEMKRSLESLLQSYQLPDQT